jgi:hypothetical protein
MAIYEKNGKLTYIDAEGNIYVLLPKTNIAQVAGLEDALDGKAPKSHILDKNNPHGVTIEQIPGLADELESRATTADLENAQTAAGNAQTKADSAYTLANTAKTNAATAQATAEAAQADFTANGAKLNSDGKVVASQATATVKYIHGTAYTLTEDDIGKCLVQAYDGTEALTITLPSGFPLGSEVEIMRYGTPAVTIAAGSGASIRAAGYGTDISSVSIANRYGVVALKRVYSANWIASGDIA